MRREWTGSLPVARWSKRLAVAAHLGDPSLAGESVEFGDRVEHARTLRAVSVRGRRGAIACALSGWAALRIIEAMWRCCALLIVAACTSPHDGAATHERVALAARAVEEPPRRDDAPPATPTVGSAVQPVDPPLELDKVLPVGTGWKCVHGNCDRTCVYPRPSHAPGPGGRVVEHSSRPPCVEQDRAFCAAFAAPGQAPRVQCRTTREACEAERERMAVVATACEER